MTSITYRVVAHYGKWPDLKLATHENLSFWNFIKVIWAHRRAQKVETFCSNGTVTVMEGHGKNAKILHTHGRLR